MFMLPTKLMANSLLYPATITSDTKNITLKFGFNKKLIEEVKSFEGARWNPDDKSWTIKDTYRNRFQLSFLGGQNPYAWFDRPKIADYQPTRSLYKHQIDLVVDALTYHYNIMAAEMGVGKTLAAIEVMEHSGITDWFWVAPKSALFAAQLEMKKWGCRIKPTFCTYEGLKKIVENWPVGKPAPQGVIFDESSRIKNPMAQRSVAARHLADSVRAEYGYNGYVIEMSGSPAPKDPGDWWHQCEVAQPGFLKEGTPQKFKKRLALIVMKDAVSGGKYPQLVTWLDNTEKCGICGKLKSDDVHGPMAKVLSTHADAHSWIPSINEVSYLYERMKGLVTVKFKKDCLDLPDKIYKQIELAPSRATLNAAKIIVASAKNTISAMTLLRELSDGFQYVDEEVGDKPCPLCDGNKTITHKMLVEDEIEITSENIDQYSGYGVEIGDLFRLPKADVLTEDVFTDAEITCPNCGGDGFVTAYKREAIQVPCPKEDFLLELLDQHEDVGRFVTFAGFKGSIDRIVAASKKLGWETIRVDGRGWKGSGILDGRRGSEMLELFQDKTRQIAKINFVAHPASGGLGLTLTESPTEYYYSNDFNAESRVQSEDRAHRIGMDINKGLTIIDAVHLPSDALIIENLKKKRKLQDMSLGLFRESIINAHAERQY
jgi:SNF2 family DNA or RNA helicase